MQTSLVAGWPTHVPGEATKPSTGLVRRQGEGAGAWLSTQLQSASPDAFAAYPGLLAIDIILLAWSIDVVSCSRLCLLPKI